MVGLSSRHVGLQHFRQTLGFAFDSKNEGHMSLNIATLRHTLDTFLADRTNGRAYATVLRLSSSVVCRL